MNYHTLVGTRRGKRPAPTYFEIPSKEIPDDGLLVPVGYDPWPQTKCPDCERKGYDRDIVWAEAGFVPGHRVCLWCGSHFELTTARAIHVEENPFEPIAQDGMGMQNSLWVLRRARFHRR